MSYFEQPLLLMLLGPPGSGKSYFARGVADKLNAVRINGDSMRNAIFGSRQETDRIYNSDSRHILNSYVFNGLDYVAEQILSRGYDVVYDATHNKRSDRQKLEQMATQCKSIPIVVWIKTPYEVAFKRGQIRDETIDQRKNTEEAMRESIERHQINTDEPTPEELVVEIDGESPFEVQFSVFTEQLKEYQR